MRTIDPDISAALETVFEARRLKHVGDIRAKHHKQLEEQITTQIQLLSDDIEEVIPKSHPAHLLVLLLAVESKITKAFKEPEFKSDLEFPNGW